MEFEKLADFNSRISSTYPIAKVTDNLLNHYDSLSLSLQFLTSLEPPGLDILESEEQCRNFHSYPHLLMVYFIF